jgi:hypothetical protein
MIAFVLSHSADNRYTANFVVQLLHMHQTFNAELKAEVEG